MINLLPEQTQSSLRALYYMRLVALVLFLAACAVFAGVALLAPSYFLARVDQSDAARSLAASTQALTAAGNGSDADTVQQVAESASLMKSYPRTPRIASILSVVTAAIPRGVSLSGITITPNDNAPDTVSVSGTASTREALLAFAGVLKTAPALDGVSVPLSQLAGEANIPFTLSFSFASPQP